MTSTSTPPAWSVYVVCCADGSLYIGLAKDVVARVAAHNAGRGARYTRPRRPVQCVWQLACETPEDARRLEGLMKRLTRKQREAVVDGDVDVVSALLAEVHRRRRAPSAA